MDKKEQWKDGNGVLIAELEGVFDSSDKKTGSDTFKDGQIRSYGYILIYGIY
jgi:hypothetical protein